MMSLGFFKVQASKVNVDAFNERDPLSIMCPSQVEVGSSVKRRLIDFKITWAHAKITTFVPLTLWLPIP